MIITPLRATSGVILSPSSRAYQMRVSTGCRSWVWLTAVIGPIANPRYQAMKPRNMLTTPR